MATMQGTAGGSSKLEPVAREQLAETSPLLKEDGAAAPVTNGISQESQSDPLQTPHGYSSFPVLAPSVNNTHSDAHIHPDLRSPSRYMAATANMMPAVAPQPGPGAPGAVAGPSNPAPPAPGAQLMPGPPPHEAGDLTSEGRKAKRELSQSKRAAQNRAAQRAFRQRKEGYIKKLEQQVREYSEMDSNFKALQSENYLLREYVIQLQARLLNAQGEYPQPPPGLSLANPHGAAAAQTSPGQLAPSGQESTQSLPPVPGAGTPLEQVAQAVANLGRAEHAANAEASAPYTDKTFKTAPMDEDARTAEEISRQLQADGLPAADM